MLKLNLKSEPFWLDLFGGVRVLVEPARSSLLEAVREDVFADFSDDDGEEDDNSFSPKTLDWAKAMARHAIQDWDGVADGNGDPVTDLSPEWIDALMEDDRCFQAFRDKYVLPALAVVEEGND